MSKNKNKRSGSSLTLINKDLLKKKQHISENHSLQKKVPLAASNCSATGVLSQQTPESQTHVVQHSIATNESDIQCIMANHHNKVLDSSEEEPATSSNAQTGSPSTINAAINLLSFKSSHKDNRRTSKGSIISNDENDMDSNSSWVFSNKNPAQRGSSQTSPGDSSDNNRFHPLRDLTFHSRDEATQEMQRLRELFILALLCSVCVARKHHLEVRNDIRRYIALSTFGFYQGGILDVKLSNFVISQEQESDLFGLSLDKTTVDAMNPYLDSHQNRCIFQEPASAQHSGPIVFFLMDLKNLLVHVTCSPDWKNLHIYKNRSMLPVFRSKRQSKVSDSSLFVQRRRRDLAPSEEHLQTAPAENKAICNDLTLPMNRTVVGKQKFYSTSFSMFVASPHEEGLYNLYFHACPNYYTYKQLSFDVDIEENNNGNFLSAGEMPLPALYFMMSLLFFLSGLFWVFILKKSKHSVYKIHYIMAVLVFLKSLSLVFHAINYHFIEVKGEHVEAWAILYYITHLLKGAVLFITIVLIGTGWTFIKHILNDKDKKIFMIVIPLQVLANVAEIIIAESEESDIEYRTWRDIFILVDLLCCGAILFPVVWSIRHLHEASATDGKAAINLRKLKLFRQFYIMIVCYIYFTRIIVYLLKITVAFQYAWLDEMFHEMATYVFFVLTGYKFRPVSSHPYFAVADDDDEDEVEVLTESGLTEGLHKTKALNRNAPPTTTVVEGNDEERENLISKRESSHEYD